MEHEVSRVSWLGVSLMALAVFIGISLFTVYLGNGVKNDAIEKGLDLIDTVSTADLKSSRELEKELPMAAIYTFLANNYEQVTVLAIEDLRATSDLDKLFTELNKASTNKEPLLGNVYKTNKVGYWSINGEGDGKAYLMSYDILNASYLEGRGYLTSYKLTDGSYGVQIIVYK